MKKFIILFSLLVGASQILAADLSPQEQQVLSSMRAMYTKQVGRPPTSEEEKQMLDNWRASVMRANGMVMQMQGVPGAGVQVPAQQAEPSPIQRSPATSAVSEEEVLRRIHAMGPGINKVSIDVGRDGLKIDGRNYLDPEGRVHNYAYDVLTGDITYSIRTRHTMVLKFLKAGTEAEPVVLAEATRDNDKWQVRTASGKQMAGDIVFPLPRGMLVGRNGSVFRYEPGKTIKSTALPDGWIMAAFQRGNVGATEYVLLERDVPEERTPSLGTLFGKFKAVGAGMGIGRKEDYALLHLQSGALHLLNVQLDGKETTAYSNCRRQNDFINKCATATSYESLFTAQGRRNFGHYYWKAYWYATEAGPIAITMENGMSAVFITHLESGKKVEAFSRTLGLSSFDASQRFDGSLTVTANWLLQDHTIEDAIKFLHEGTDVRLPDAQTGSAGAKTTS